MARIRTIKPEFWTSEQIMNLPPVVRLFFIGIWNFVDDYGNHPNSPVSLKARIFPGDAISSNDCSDLLQQLADAGLIEFYEAEGKQFFHVTGWHHQRIDKPTRKYPSHPNQPEFEERSARTRRKVVEDSKNVPRALDERSTPEGIQIQIQNKTPHSLSRAGASDDANLPTLQGRPENPGQQVDQPEQPKESEAMPTNAAVTMSLDWKPDPRTLKTYALRFGIPVEAFTDEATAGFVVHHNAKGMAKTPREWVADLVAWVKRDHTRAARVVRFQRKDNGKAEPAEDWAAAEKWGPF